MLEWAWKLKKAIQKWVKTKNHEQLNNLFIQDSEWKKVTNIIKIFRFFTMLTEAIDIILQISVHSVFQSFSWLFDQIEDTADDLKKKTKKKNELLKILEAAKKKLRIYYEKTSDIYNQFYNLVIILNSSIRLNLYKMSFLNYHSDLS